MSRYSFHKKNDNRQAVNAIEQGIITDSTKQRLQELEDKRKDLELQMIQEQISKPQYTREQYLEFFSKAKNLDLSKQRNRKFLIDTFVNYCVFSESEKAANDKLLKFKKVFEFTPE